MGNKTLRYSEGGWVFLRAVLDFELNKMLDENFAVKGFHNTKDWDDVRSALSPPIGLCMATIYTWSPPTPPPKPVPYWASPDSDLLCCACQQAHTELAPTPPLLPSSNDHFAKHTFTFAHRKYVQEINLVSVDV